MILYSFFVYAVARGICVSFIVAMCILRLSNCCVMSICTAFVMKRSGFRRTMERAMRHFLLRLLSVGVCLLGIFGSLLLFGSFCRCLLFTCFLFSVIVSGCLFSAFHFCVECVRYAPAVFVFLFLLRSVGRMSFAASGLVFPWVFSDLRLGGCRFVVRVVFLLLDEGGDIAIGIVLS